MSRDRRLALTALLILAPVPSIGVVLGVILWPGPVGKIYWGICKGILYGLPAFWLLFVERQRPSWSPPKKGGFFTGTCLGVAISGLILATWYLVGRENIDPSALRSVAAKHGFDTHLTYIGVALYVSVVNALLEEYAFRWFIFTRCRALLPAIPALILSALVFTAHHTLLLSAYGIAPTLVALASAGVFVGGLTWSWCHDRYRSVWPGYVSHAIVDVAILVIGWQIIFG